MNPDLQHDLREEISFCNNPSFDELNQRFPLLDAVLKETLRVHPAILENHHVVGCLIPSKLSNNWCVEYLGCKDNQCPTIPASSRLLRAAADNTSWHYSGHTRKCHPIGSSYMGPRRRGLPSRTVAGAKEGRHQQSTRDLCLQWRVSTFTMIMDKRFADLLHSSPRTCIGKAFASAEIKVCLSLDPTCVCTDDNPAGAYYNPNPPVHVLVTSRDWGFSKLCDPTTNSRAGTQLSPAPCSQGWVLELSFRVISSLRHWTLYIKYST
jgi:hypothetical protein